MGMLGKMIDDEVMKKAPDIIGAYLVGTSDPAEHLRLIVRRKFILVFPSDKTLCSSDPEI